MKTRWFKRAASLLVLGTVLCAAGCDDDNDKNKEYKVNTQEQWIGAACSCDATASNSNCDILTIPIPNGQPIVGCDNMGSAEGAAKVCLRTIDGAKTITAPETYFPQGYCSLSAVECTVSNLCSMGAAYGDYTKFTTCPAGSALVEGEFDYALMGDDNPKAHFRQKFCTKLCNSDADCNTAGDMHCINKKGVNICYNDKNFVAAGEPTKVTAFE